MRIITFIMLLSLSLPSWAGVSASVDKNPALAGEIVQLTVRSDSSKKEPELGSLSQDFQILSQHSSSQFQMVNGRTSRNYEWVYQLRPLRLGQLRIPPIRIDGESSDEILLTVQKPNTQAGQWPEAYIEFSAEKTEAWLREQVILDFKLYVRGDLVSGNFNPPSADNAVIETLGEQQQSQAIKGQHRYKVIQQRYALFAEQSGVITINGPMFNGELATPGQRPSVFGFSRARRPIYAAGDPISLNILAPPTNLGGADWLPASSVSITEELQPDSASLQAGEPLTRVIRLRVDGQLHTQLPALDIASPANAQAYTEPPQDSTRSDGLQMIAMREYSTAIIAGNGRFLELPGLELNWWNTQSNQLETARLPARKIPLTGQTPSVTPSPAPIPQAPPQTAQPGSESAISEPAQSTHLWIWQVAAIACGAGWLGTLLAWFWISRNSTARPRQQSPNKHAQLIKTLNTGSAAEVRQALLDWAREQNGRYLSLSALAASCHDAQVRSALMGLDAAACGRSDSFDRQSLVGYVESKQEQPQAAHALPPLYPES